MKMMGVFLTASLYLVPALASAADAPLRTMVYHFDFSQHSFGGSPAMGGPFGGTVVENGAAGTDGRSGTIEIQAIRATEDGGLVVDVTEHIDRSQIPAQKVRCAVYGDSGDVICDQNFSPTDEERVLLTYIGRFFYNPAKVDANGTWTGAPSRLRSSYKVTNTYRVTKTDGSLLTIAVDHQEKGFGFEVQTTGTVVYDSALEIPHSIDLSTSAVNSGNQGDAKADLTLLSDSMAASQSAH